MMRSLFSGAQFARFDLGSHVLSQSMAPMEPQTAFSLNDILSKVGIDQSDISKIQDPKVKEEFKANYDRCASYGLDTAKGLGCMAELGAKVYAKLQEEQKAPFVAAPVQQPTSNSPWIPIALGLTAAGGLVYFLATKGK